MTEQHCSRKKSSSRLSFPPAIKLIPCHMDIMWHMSRHICILWFYSLPLSLTWRFDKITFHNNRRHPEYTRSQRSLAE
jgi:hypothetical protein